MMVYLIEKKFGFFLMFYNLLFVYIYIVLDGLIKDDNFFFGCVVK